MAKVSIVVLQYNKSDLTLKCLESLRPLKADVIVVDNASEVQHLKNVEYWIETNKILNFKLKILNENGGYSKGNNQGIKQALVDGAENILILNNDVVVEPDFLERLLRIEKDIVGIESGEIQWLKTELPLSKERPNANIVPPNHYLSGLALLVKREVFDKIGLFDERYFLYFEDVDFSVRAHAAGFSLGLARAHYSHATSSTTSSLGAANLLYYHTRNALLFNKSHGPWWVQIALPIWKFWIKLKQHIKLVLRKNLENSRAILQGINDYDNNRFGMRVN